MGMPVSELLQRVSSAELTEWIAFYKLEPWGTERDDWRAALVAATTANYSGKVKKPLQATDFMPPPVLTEQQRIEQSIANMRATLGG